MLNGRWGHLYKFFRGAPGDGRVVLQNINFALLRGGWHSGDSYTVNRDSTIVGTIAPAKPFVAGVVPLTTIAFQQFPSFARPPRSRWVVRKITRRQSMPHIENGLNDAPTGFH